MFKKMKKQIEEKESKSPLRPPDQKKGINQVITTSLYDILLASSPMHCKFRVVAFLWSTPTGMPVDFVVGARRGAARGWGGAPLATLDSRLGVSIDQNYFCFYLE